MKINKLIFTVCTAGLIFASCATETGNEPNNDNAKGKLKIALDLATTKAILDESPAAVTGENAVDIFTAFVFNGAGVAVTPQITSNSGDEEIVFENVSTEATEVYVIANAPSSLFTASISKAALLEVIGNYDNSGTSTQQPGKVWASGHGAIGLFTPDAEDNNVMKAEVDVALTFVPAKITVNSVTVDASGNDGAADFAIKNMYLVNAASQSLLFGDGSLVVNPAEGGLSTGIDIADESYEHPTATYTILSYLKDVINASATLTSKYYYYAFENSAAAAPTMIVFEFEIDPDGAGEKVKETRYLAYHFSTGDAGHFITRGKNYVVDFTIKVSSKLGNIDITTPSTSGELTVTVTPAEWTPVALAKTFE